MVGLSLIYIKNKNQLSWQHGIVVMSGAYGISWPDFNSIPNTYKLCDPKNGINLFVPQFPISK